MKKLIYISSIMIILFISISTITLAGDIDTGKLKDIYNGNSSSLNTMAGKILGVMQVVGTAVAIIVLIFIGVKYMFSSPADKAEYKKTLTGYLIGAIILFAASNILGIIKEFVDSSLNA